MSAPQAGNGFVGAENCFVAGGATKQFPENFNDFSRLWSIQPDPRSLAQSRSFNGRARHQAVAGIGFVRLSQCGREAPRQRDGLEPKSPRSRLIRTACNLSACWRVVTKLSAKDAVLGRANIEAGNKTPTRDAGRSTAQRPTGTDNSAEPRIEAPNTLRIKRPGVSGAMSQQCGDSGSHSMPQKFLHLVGCREPRARAEPPSRPAPVKR
jgi:hypothetical protein